MSLEERSEVNPEVLLFYTKGWKNSWKVDRPLSEQWTERHDSQLLCLILEWNLPCSSTSFTWLHTAPACLPLPGHDGRASTLALPTIAFPPRPICYSVQSMPMDVYLTLTPADSWLSHHPPNQLWSSLLQRVCRSQRSEHQWMSGVCSCMEHMPCAQPWVPISAHCRPSCLLPHPV